MKYSIVFLSLWIFIGCGDKPQKSSGLVTPELEVLAAKEIISKQELPDTVETLGNLIWHSNIKEAFALAQKEKRRVVVMVGEDDCRWCIKMKKRTLSDPRVQQALQKYILVSIKRSDKASVKYVPEFDGNIPSFFFMEYSQELIEPIVGYFNADDFSEYIQEIERL